MIRQTSRLLQKYTFSKQFPSLIRASVFYIIIGVLINQIKPISASSLENANELHSKAALLFEQGNIENAIPYMEKALVLYEKAVGSENPELGQIRDSIASMYENTGDYDKALAAYEKEYRICSKNLGKKHNDTLVTLSNIARCAQYLGDYPKAIELLESLVSIRKSMGKESDTASSLNNLASIYSWLGDAEKALPLVKKSLEIREKELGVNHPDTITEINNLAETYSSLEDTENALKLYNRILKIYEATDTDDPYTSIYLGNVAMALSRSGDYSRAIDIAQKALNISNGKQDSQTALKLGSLLQLGCIYDSMGEFDKSLQNLKHALTIAEKLGDKSATLNQIALTSYKSTDSSSAEFYGKQYVNELDKELKSVLLLDEHSRLAWQKKNHSFWYASIFDSSTIAELLIRWKGVVLDSLAEDRALAFAAGSSVEGSAILQKIKSLQGRLSKITFEQGQEAEANKLQDEVGLLQRELTSKYLGRDRQRASANMKMSDVVPALAEGGVLVDFIQFDDPKLKGDQATCLGGIITGEDNNPVFVRIDGGTAINRAIDSLRAAINQGNSIEVEAQTKFLSEKLWAPIAAKIPEGTKRLYLCPDANLNFLSFASLLESDGRFVAEKYPITYIGSARDLAKKPSCKILKSMALIANPQFDAVEKNAKTQDRVAMRSAEASVFGTISLPPLPGTEVEAASLQSLAKESGWQTKSYLGKDATESIVRNTKKPGVLHLATHGFYLNSFTPPGPEGSRGMSVVGVKETTDEKKKKEKGVDPMRASGVALTGAQQTLTSWSQKKAPNPETDGVLTAEEVGALRLDGTWMVVLSACETGVGEALSGEGVFGLRRAFMIAGAENLLMTLWPVADETTAKIMTDFYKEAFATGDAPGSLAKVQRDWLVKIRQERGLLAAIREAGPFAMVTMTNPNAQREFVEGQLEVAPEKAAIPKSDKILEFQVALAKAEAGDAYAQAVVSIYYGLGVGCDQDPAKSKDYVMLSAKQQNPLGIYRLGEMRESGEGMDQNSEQALQLMKKAKPGLQKLSTDPYALTALATIYERENPDSPKIREVLTKASEMGYEPAQEKLNQLPTNQ